MSSGSVAAAHWFNNDESDSLVKAVNPSSPDVHLYFCLELNYRDDKELFWLSFLFSIANFHFKYIGEPVSFSHQWSFRFRASHLFENLIIAFTIRYL